jgi:hypothetical protein
MGTMLYVLGEAHVFMVDIPSFFFLTWSNNPTPLLIITTFYYFCTTTSCCGGTLVSFIFIFHSGGKDLQGFFEVSSKNLRGLCEVSKRKYIEETLQIFAISASFFRPPLSSYNDGCLVVLWGCCRYAGVVRSTVQCGWYSHCCLFWCVVVLFSPPSSSSSLLCLIARAGGVHRSWCTCLACSSLPPAHYYLSPACSSSRRYEIL